MRNFDKVLKLEPNNKATIKECDEIKSKLGQKNVKIDSSSLNGSNRDPSSKLTALSTGNPLRTANSSGQSKSNSSTGQNSAPTKKPIKVEKIVVPKLHPVRLPDSLPKTAYQFNLIWKEIKDTQTKVDYLQFVGADHFLKLFQKNLEPDFLSELIALFTKMQPNLVFALLNSISKIEKFDFLIMFLSKDEKVSLRQTIDSLQADSADLELLTRIYKV